MAPKRVYVSFDFDRDATLKDFLVGQARNADSPFEVVDWSLKESAPQRDWEARARERIRRSDIVIVMVGPQTYRASGVLKEVAIARDEDVSVVQIAGYRGSNPTRVANAGVLYRWDWENLKKILK